MFDSPFLFLSENPHNFFSFFHTPCPFGSELSPVTVPSPFPFLLWIDRDVEEKGREKKKVEPEREEDFSFLSPLVLFSFFSPFNLWSFSLQVRRGSGSGLWKCELLHPLRLGHEYDSEHGRRTQISFVSGSPLWCVQCFHNQSRSTVSLCERRFHAWAPYPSYMSVSPRVVGKGQARAQAVLLYSSPLFAFQEVRYVVGFSTTRSSDSCI